MKVTESSSFFFTHFAEELVNRLAFDPAIESPQNAYAEALYSWLNHISTSSIWGIYRPFFPRSYVLSVCEQCSSHWTQALSKELEKKGKATKATPITSGNSFKSKRTSSKSSMPVEANITSKLSGHGWEHLQKWDSRPFGISSIN